MYLKNRPNFTGGYVQPFSASPTTSAGSVATPSQKPAPREDLFGEQFSKEFVKVFVRTGQAGADLLSKVTGITPVEQRGSGKLDTEFREWANAPATSASGVAGAVGGNIVSALLSPSTALGRGLATTALTKGVARKSAEFTAKEGAKGFAKVIPRLGGVASEFVSDIVQGGAQAGEINKSVVGSAALSSLPAIGGKLPRGAFATIQTLKGAKEIAEGDTAMGTFDVAMGLTAIPGVKRAKGALLEEPLRTYFPPNVEKEIAKVTQNLEEIIPLGIGKKISVAGQKAELKGAQKINPVKTIVENGVRISTKADGTFDTTDAIKAFENRINTADDLLEDVLKQNPQKRNSLQALKTAALRRVDESPVFGLEDEKDAAKRELSTILDKEIAKRGDLVDDLSVQQIKRGLGQIGYDQARPVKNKEAIRMTQNLFKETLEENNKDVADVAKINQAMAEMLEARRVLTDLSGRLPRGGGRLTKQLNQIIGTVVGNRFGVVGSIAGGKIAKKLGDLASDPYLITDLERRGVDVSKYISTQEKAVRESAESLMSSRFRKPLPQLPEPKPANKATGLEAPVTPQVIPLGPRSVESKVMSQEEAISRLREGGWQGPLSQEDFRALRGKGAFATMSKLYEGDENSFYHQQALKAEKEALSEFSLPGVNQTEAKKAYKVYKSIADRFAGASDEYFDAQSLLKRYGREKYQQIMRPLGGGELTDDELLTAFKERFRNEKRLRGVMINPPVEDVF